MSENVSVHLRVSEAGRADVGRGIARLGGSVRSRLGISPGDIVEIIGKRSTVAVVWPLHSSNDGGLIKIDGYVRHNAGVSIGETVAVKKARVEKARKVIMGPTQPIRFGKDFNQYVKQQLLGHPVGRNDIVTIPVLGEALQMMVVTVNPGPYAIIDRDTELVVREAPAAEEEMAIPRVTYEDIGGLTKEIQRVRELIELPLKHPELFRHLGIEPPKGVLLHGPPGTGKTLMAKAVANESGAHFITINGPEIMSKWYGESEKRLREVFKEAKESAPSIIFIDELDAVAPKREEVTGEVEKRVVAQLLSLMDGMESMGDLVVIGATNRPEALDPALRRPGRFDREIIIGVPDRFGRKEILEIHTRGMPLAEDVNVDDLSRISHGFVGADLAALAKEAAMSALRRFLPQIDIESETIPTEMLEKMKVTRADFDEALKDIQPSTLREVYLEIPELRWDDIGGLETVKEQLREAVEWPLKYPDLFKRLGVRAAKGILLFGPPGTGKTMLARATATESESNFIAIRGPEILSKWVGESEKAVRKIFQKARQSAPCIIFLDELDAIVPRRGMEIASSGVTERIVNQLLSEMDGIETLKSVVVVGATNRPDMLDPALLRPGRFDKIIYVPPPDLNVRKEIFKIHTNKMPLAEDVDLKRLAELTDGYTGADVEAICLEAAMTAAREDINTKEVRSKHFETALKVVPSSISPAEIREYERIAEKISRKLKEKPKTLTPMA